MKLTLILFAICSSLSALHAADPVVIVHSATRVTVDGTDYGKPADAIANNRALAPAIQRALEQWAAKITSERDDAKAALAAKTSRIQAVLTTRLDAEQKTGEGPRVRLLRELITEAETPEKVLKRQALEAEISAKKKELDAIK